MKTILLLSLIVLVGACSPQPPSKSDAPIEASLSSAPPVTSTMPAWRDLLHPSVAAPAPAPKPDLRTSAQITQAACTGADGSWRCVSKKPVVMATSTSVPIIPSSWTVPNWYIDPANASGCASDSNSCTSSTCGGTGVGPCLTWQQINSQRWGCQGNPAACPRLRQTTTITWLSSAINDSDPVSFTPQMENGINVTLQGGTPATVATVSLAGTTSKSRAAGSNSLLITTLGASGAVGQLLSNTTHPSRAWVYRSLGGNSFDITQPLVAQSAGAVLPAPAEVDTWTNTDSVTLLTPIAVNFVYLAPVSDGLLSVLSLYQLSAYDPGGTGASQLTISESGSALVDLQEMSVKRNLFVSGTSSEPITVANVEMAGSVQLTGSFIVRGGATMPSSTNVALSVTGTFQNSILDADMILGVGSGPIVMSAPSLNLGLGFVYIDTSVAVQSGIVEGVTGSYSGHVIYGGAGDTINMLGTSHFFLASGTFTNGFTAPALITPGIQFNGTSAACSSSNANNPDVINCAIGSTVAHLDAAQGTAGFGGSAFALGGASVSTAN